MSTLTHIPSLLELIWGRCRINSPESSKVSYQDNVHFLKVRHWLAMIFTYVLALFMM